MPVQNDVPPRVDRIIENERLRQKFDSMWEYYDLAANDSADRCDIAIANALDQIKAAMKG